MSDLHDMAKDLGVETHGSFNFHTQIHDGQGDYAPLTYPRPDLDIAHECLAKLPENCGLIFWPNKQQWAADWTDGTMDGDELIAVGTFIECVIELWKRQKASS